MNQYMQEQAFLYVSKLKRQQPVEHPEMDAQPTSRQMRLNLWALVVRLFRPTSHHVPNRERTNVFEGN